MTGIHSNVMQIKTPEGVAFSLPLASPIARLLAWSVDLGLIALAWLALVFALGLSLVLGGLATAIYYLAFFAISVGYGIAAEWFWRGQTFGKRLLRLRVVDAQGFRLQFNQIVMRNLLRFVDSLPAFYLIGGVACLLSRRCQRLGDLAANTVVVHVPKLSQPDLDAVVSGKFNSLRKHPHLVARLRQRVSPTEAALALQALLRREQMDANGRVALFAELANHFRELTPFPADTTEGITDEQYVRNVVEVIYRTDPPGGAKAKGA